MEWVNALGIQRDCFRALVLGMKEKRVTMKTEEG